MVWWALQDLNLQPTDYESARNTPLTWESAGIRQPCCKSVAADQSNCLNFEGIVIVL